MVYCRECMKARTLRFHHLTKLKAVAYKGGKCEVCGQMPHPCAMQFHHSDPRSKRINVARLRFKAFEELLPELDKCVLLCANCHAVQHAGDDWDQLDVPLILEELAVTFGCATE